jgi:hypothetical protein
MKDSHLRVRSLMVALVVLTLTSVSVHAQDAGGNFLSDLHKFRVSNYMALDAYYRFSASNDTDTLNEIVAGVNAANDSMNTIAGSTEGILSPEQVEALNQEFDKFKNLMRDNINDVRKTGYPDLRLVSDMANQAQSVNDMATDLYHIARESSPANSRVEAARSAAVMMAQMMARYSVRTNSSVSQTFQGSATEEGLDVQAREFDSLLAQVRKGGSDGDLKASLDDVSSKWQFIRSSYINYNEKNVGFVIDRYSKGILNGLDTAIGLLLGQN